METKQHEIVEAVVVGAGAAGAAATWCLATGGVRVVCLERGGWVGPDDIPTDRPDWEVHRQRSHHPNPNIRRLPQDYPIEDSGTPIRPLMYNAVGGSTIHWGAHFPRLHPADFKARRLDGVGEDWPIDYADLEPFYDENDRMMGVSGIAGDPANPPRSPRQTPPVPLGLAGERVAAALDRLGWHWWPVDAAINTVAYGDGRGACNNCGPCDLGCPVGARSSTDLTYWPAALDAGAELRTGARVTRVETGPDGRARGVEYLDADGVRHHQPAETVVLAGNGVGTSRLLLLSATDRQPDGLANSSGLVGRHLMHHPTGMVTGVFEEPLAGFKGPFATTLVSQQFYETDQQRGFVRGYQMQLIRSDGPLGTALGGYLVPVPWGASHHVTFEQQFGHTASLTVTTEDLPDPDNRVTLDDELVDADGLPAPRLTYRVDDNASAMIEHGIGSASTILREAGAVDVVAQDLVESAGFHLLGTARMGLDPERSVVDPWCRAHDVDNLVIVDGSVFVTAGAVNPTSTIQAIALRAAERIVDPGTQREGR